MVAWPGLVTQPPCKAPSDLRVEHGIKKAVVNIDLVRVSPQQWQKSAVGQPKKKDFLDTCTAIDPC